MMSAISLANNGNQVFATKHNMCINDASLLPSILRMYCKCDDLTILSSGNTKVTRSSSMKSTKRASGRKSFLSPWSIVPRGGGITEKTPLVEQYQHHPLETNMASQKRVAIPLSSLPLVDIKTVSLALRLTCETNRRLHLGTSIERGCSGTSNSDRQNAAVPDGSTDGAPSQHHPSLQQQMMIPTTENSPAVRFVSEEESIKERRKEDLTVFHSSELWEEQNMGADELVNATDSHTDAAAVIEQPGESQTGVLQSWGPDLQLYLVKLLSAMGLGEKEYAPNGNSDNKQPSPMEDELQIILSLTLIYLDRSSSLDMPLHVDPHTGRPWYPSCPHLLPQTVHRMLLTAMLISTKCVRGNESDSEALRGAANSMLGKMCAISQEDMEQMENWMVNALGGVTETDHQQHHQPTSYWQVSQEEVGSFLRKWGGTFYPQRLRAHDQSRMKQLERFWRDQAPAVFGGQQHGHGNYHWPEKTGEGAHYHHNRNQQASLQYGSTQMRQSLEQQHSYDHHLAEQDFYDTSTEPF